MKPFTIKLTGPALVIARRVKTTHDEANAAHEALMAEFQERSTALALEQTERMKAEWVELFKVLNLPISEIGAWRMDAQYLDAHGIAVISRDGDGDNDHLATLSGRPN